jgi:hypothetical protein
VILSPGGSRHHETRQYFIKHNTLVDMLALMQRENELLDMIHAAISEQGWVEKFRRGYTRILARLSSEHSKKALIDTLSHIVDGVKVGKLNVRVVQKNIVLRMCVSHMQADKRHTAVTDEAQLLDAQLHDMVNNQRLYNKTVLDMQTV